MNWKSYLRVRTHDPNFLWKMVATVLLVGGLLGILADALPSGADALERQVQARSSRGESQVASEAFRRLIDDPRAPFEQVLDALGSFRREDADPESNRVIPIQRIEAIDPQKVSQVISESDQPLEQKSLLESLWQSLWQGEPDPKLIVMAAEEPPRRFANHALGVFWDDQQNYAAAARAFEKEGASPDAVRSRKSAVAAFLQAEDYESLLRLREQELYQDALPAWLNCELAARNSDWSRLWWSLPATLVQTLEPASVLLALITGAAWLAFVIQAGQPGSRQGAPWWMCVVAVLLGVLSVWPTLFLGFWQEKVMGLKESSDVIDGLKFFVVGVGLREETSKLLLFLPLVPWLAPRKSDLASLIVAASVGLGFAIEENVGYFSRTMGTASMARFLTANFFHMAATGLIGLAVMRAVRWGGAKILDAVAMFVIIVFAHGMYDAVLSIPEISQYQLGHSIVYILLAYQFFHELRGLRTNAPETISLTATFLFSVSLLASVTFVYIASQIGWKLAGDIVIGQSVAFGAMIYMFLREIPNSLIRG